MQETLSRRDMLRGAAATAAALAGWRGFIAGADDADAIRKTPSYNPEMEYRRLGKTGLWVSAVCLGGHWKRINKIIKGRKENVGYLPITGEDQPAFEKNRYDVISRCIEVGINLVDACSGAEIMVYSRALKGRRDKMYMAWSWYEKESRFPEWRTAAKLLQGLDEGMKEAGVDHVDLWRISALMDGKHTEGEVQEQIKALDIARKQGKVRFTGFSSHAREWLRMLCEKYPEQVQFICTPYTADSKVLPNDSLFDAVRKCDVGVLGIKPFASNSLFAGDGSPEHPEAEADNRRARLAIRNILANPAITAPIPGLISIQQVDNMALAVKERRQLDLKERAELDEACRQMWARLPADYGWLKEWRFV